MAAFCVNRDFRLSWMAISILVSSCGILTNKGIKLTDIDRIFIAVTRYHVKVLSFRFNFGLGFGLDLWAK